MCGYRRTGGLCLGEFYWKRLLTLDWKCSKSETQVISDTLQEGAGGGGGGYLAGTHDSSCTEADLIKRKQRKNKQTISRLSAQASHFERGRQLLSLVSSRPMTPAASQPLAVSRMGACLFAMRIVCLPLLFFRPNFIDRTAVSTDNTNY